MPVSLPEKFHLSLKSPGLKLTTLIYISEILEEENKKLKSHIHHLAEVGSYLKYISYFIFDTLFYALHTSDIEFFFVEAIYRFIQA